MPHTGRNRPVPPAVIWRRVAAAITYACWAGIAATAYALLTDHPKVFGAGLCVLAALAAAAHQVDAFAGRLAQQGDRSSVITVSH